MNEEYHITYQTTITLTEEDITDIVVTALEGGINYWACLDNTTDEFNNAPDDEPISITTAKILLSGGTVIFYDNEDDLAVFKLTLDKLLKGIKNYAEWRGFDMDYIDADMADCIVQYALFDEVVYG